MTKYKYNRLRIANDIENSFAGICYPKTGKVFKKILLATVDKPDKECKCVNCEGGLNKKMCLNKISTPSPLDEIEEIEKITNNIRAGASISYLVDKLIEIQNQLIRNQNLIIKELKRK